MKKLFSTRIGAILTAVAMLIAMLPGTMAVMAAGEVTGDGAYIAVDELEHYALTVNNDTVKNTLITVTVSFWNKGEGDSYTPVSINALKFNNTNLSTYSSLERTMYGSSNVFNFTTPKNCDYVTVTIVDGSSAPLSLPISIDKTSEVLNNGTFEKGTSGATNAVPGWYYNNASTTYNNTLCRVEAVKVSAAIYQCVTLKAGATYRLKFKFAQSVTDGQSIDYKRPRGLQFDKVQGGGTEPSLLYGGATNKLPDVTLLTQAPATDADWTEYVVDFTAGTATANTGMDGLWQARLRVDCLGPTGYTYYDDISIEEILVADENTYIAVDELEHYALKVENSDVADEAISVNVNFWKQGEEETYTPITIAAYNSYDIDTGNKTSLNRYMCGTDNTFNFTTPKDCDYISVTAIASDKTTSLPLPFKLNKTTEVLNNGDLAFGQAGTTTAVPGWSVTWASSYYDSEAERFALNSDSSTRIYQSVTLKAGATYRLKFKFAPKATNEEALKYNNPRVYFDKGTGSIHGTLPRGEGMFEDTVKLTAVPSANGDWTEYEMTFVAGEGSSNVGMEGLYQARMLVRHYAAKEDSKAEGTVYYDDFSLEEVDGGSYISYMDDRYEYSVSGKSLADKVRYHYVKAAGDTERKFIYAEYDANDKLTYVKVIDVSVTNDYDIAINDGSLKSKVFVIDSEKLIPYITAIED